MEERQRDVSRWKVGYRGWRDGSVHLDKRGTKVVHIHHSESRVSSSPAELVISA